MSFGPKVTASGRGGREDRWSTSSASCTDDGRWRMWRCAIASTRFASGTALVEAAKELEEPLKADEVRQ